MYLKTNFGSINSHIHFIIQMLHINSTKNISCKPHLHSPYWSIQDAMHKCIANSIEHQRRCWSLYTKNKMPPTLITRTIGGNSKLDIREGEHIWDGHFRVANNVLQLCFVVAFGFKCGTWLSSDGWRLLWENDIKISIFELKTIGAHFVWSIAHIFV